MTLILILYLIGAALMFGAGVVYWSVLNNYFNPDLKSKVLAFGVVLLYSAGWPIVLLLAGGGWLWAFVQRWWSVRRMD